MTMLVRKYRPGEEAELWQLFFDTVHFVNLGDYDAAQVRAWAPEVIDEEGWRLRIERNQPYVCECDDRIVGFADVQSTGYIDQFFVHHAWQGRGIGKRLFAAIETEARQRQVPELSSNVSITARPFFESRGFQVVSSQIVRVGEVELTNFKMVKALVSN